MKEIEVTIPMELARHALDTVERNGRYVTVREKGNRTHPLMRVIGFYLLLKAEAPESGWIQNYTKQIPELSTFFGIGQRSFYTYLNKLEKLNLAHREGKKIRLAGWAAVGKEFNISTAHKIKIKFNGTQNLHWWFAALEIEENQDIQAQAIWKKLDKNSNVKQVLLEALQKRGFDMKKIANPGYWVQRLYSLYLENFQFGTEVHEILINLRADVNRSVKKIGWYWNISPQLVSYWKKIMSEQRIIGVSKLSIMSSWTPATAHCHQNPNCHVTWDKKNKERVWFLCDQITVLKHWEWREFLKKSTEK